MNADDKKKMFTRDIASREWLGEIVNVEDSLKMLRCKIRVYGLFNDIEDDLLPWAFPAYSSGFSSAKGGFGSFDVPKKGTIVKVKFNNGDIYAGEYFAVQNINETIRNEISNDYVNAHVICFDEDEDLRILYTQNQGLVLKLKGTLINVLNNNNIFINNPNGDSIELTNGGELNIKTSDNINVTTGKDVNVECQNLTVTAHKKIRLGANAEQALVLGTLFKPMFDNHFHIGNLGAPTGPAKANGFICDISELSFTQKAAD
ncbi:MAG: hypothetical protein WC979_01650 [Candidatus Pacearchaeota archaeon]|jgi:hypothetical protein|nr:phage baseplate assembly protein V [Clostridia bacterium]